MIRLAQGGRLDCVEDLWRGHGSWGQRGGHDRRSGAFRFGKEEQAIYVSRELGAQVMSNTCRNIAGKFRNLVRV